MMAPSQKQADAPIRPAMPHPALRAILSVLFAAHLLAIFAAPLSLRPTPSAVSRAVAGFFQPYLDTAYLNHGYGFFSPDPGSSFIMRWEAELPDGTIRRGVLPDLVEHWPRLRYHRHFMLTSQATAFEGMPLPASYARHIKKSQSARRVRLEFVEHTPPTAEAVIKGMALSDPSTYRVVGIATIDENGKVELRQIPVPPPTPGEDVTPAPLPGSEAVPGSSLEAVPISANGRQPTGDLFSAADNRAGGLRS